MKTTLIISELNSRIKFLEGQIDQIQNEYIPEFLMNPYNAKYPENSTEVFEAMIEARRLKISEIEQQVREVLQEA